MPRGKLLNKDEQVKIMAYKDAGFSNREIALKISRSHNLVNNFVKLGILYGKNHRKGGNKKLSRRQISLILRAASNQNVTAGQIQAELDLPVSKRRIQQILRKSKRFVWTKKASKPPLSRDHIKARLAFARTHMCWNEEWKNVIFSDEKKFNLDGPDGFKYYWHDLSKSHDIAMSRNFGGGSVMIWAAFRYSAKTPICWISTKMNSEKYTNLLEDVLIPFMEEEGAEECIFQQDNASIHTSRVTKEWFQRKNIELMQ